MSDYEVPPVQPTDEDEKLALKYQRLIQDEGLRAQPNMGERCDRCLYYLNPDEEMSYCWHPRLQLLVGGDWWCQRWEQTPEEG